MTGHGGWPLNVFLTPDQVPFYGGTYFPPQPRQGMPSGSRSSSRCPTRGCSGARRSASRASAWPRGCGRRVLRPSEQPMDAAHARQRRGRAQPAVRRPVGRLGQPRRSSRPPRCSSSCSAGARSRWRSRRCTRCAAAASTTRSAAASRATRSTGPGPCRTSRRCSTTTACSPAPTCTASRSPATSGCGAPARRRSSGCAARCARPRAASTARSTPTPRASRAGTTSGRSRSCARRSADLTRRSRSRGSTRPRRATSRARTCSRRAAPSRRRRRAAHPRAAVRGARAAGAARPGRQAARVVERAGDRGVRRRGRRARRDGLVDVARGAAAFVLDAMRAIDGRLLRTCNDGRAKLDAYLEDHAFLLEALLVLYEATFEERWFTEARALADTMLERFADPDRGGFFTTSVDHEALVARRKDLEDHPIPSGGSSAALGLLRLAALTGEHRYEEPRPSGTCGCSTRSRRATRGVRAPPPGARLPPRPGARGRAGGRRRRGSSRGSSAACAAGRARGGPGRRTARSAAAGGPRPGRRAAPRPTCASASPAGGR